MQFQRKHKPSIGPSTHMHGCIPPHTRVHIVYTHKHIYEHICTHTSLRVHKCTCTHIYSNTQPFTPIDYEHKSQRGKEEKRKVYRKESFKKTMSSVQNMQRAVNLKFVCPIYCSTGLYVCFCARTILF